MKSSLLVSVIGVVLVGWIGYTVIYTPQQRQLQAIQAQLLQEQSAQQIQTELADLFGHIERYRQRLPSEPDPSWLVREVVEIAGHSGIELTSIVQEAPQQVNNATQLRVNLQFAASYHGLGTFLDNLERSPRFIRVEHFQIDQGRERSASTVALSCSTIYLTPAATLAGPSAGATP